MDKPTYNKETFYHWTEIKTRFRDLDPLNHVNNAVFNTYFEEARIDFIRQIPGIRTSMESGNSFILVHLELDYLKPILFGDTVMVGSAIEEYGNTSVKAFQAIYSLNNKKLKAVAKTTGVWFDLKKNRPVRLPEIDNREQYLYKNSDG